MNDLSLTILHHLHPCRLLTCNSLIRSGEDGEDELPEVFYGKNTHTRTLHVCRKGFGILSSPSSPNGSNSLITYIVTGVRMPVKIGGASEVRQR